MKHIKSELWAMLLLTISLLLPSATWADGSHKLTVTAKPTMAGTFNTSTAELVAGETINLHAYPNDNFDFIQWTDNKGNVVSKELNFNYLMPDHDVTLTAEYEYNPANPTNPAINYWNKETGEVIVDDFKTGQLQTALRNAIGNSNSGEVTMITVAGIMNNNDFGVANNYNKCTLLDISRVTGITQIPSYAFDNTSLASVYLPASIESIGARAFYQCGQLTTLTIYAMTPPTLEEKVFSGVPDGMVVYVPAAAIAQYLDADIWKEFTLLPIQEDIRNINVSLPATAKIADYENLWLELTNTKNGQRMHYVMTDRQAYTFANIIRNTSWNVVLRNERGDVFGQIDNVEVKDEDVSVMFSTLSRPQKVSLAVQTSNGQNVTSQAQITWTDAQGNYVAQGASLTGLPVGYKVNYRVALSQELAMLYDTPQAVDYVLKDEGNDIVCQLQAIKQLQISGKVKDAATGLPLSGATVSASQTFGGKYSKTLNAKTDNKGEFTLTIANVPTSIAFASSDYVSQTVDLSNYELSELSEFAVPDVSLKSITGATINIGFTYTTVEGETQNWFSDYQNVNYELFNVTKNLTVSQYNVQYPQIVLLEEVEDGDVLRLQATSRTNAFMPVEATATIAEQKAEATFGIVELGQIQSTFTKTGNASVVGSLYDADGKLVKTYDYANALLTVSNLADGSYTLVTMGSSRLFNTIYDLSQLPQTGLAEGSDYVLNTVEVKSGAISQINIDEVPTLDESKLYYTGDNTSFTVNKPSIVAGNYLTLTGRIDFKPAYATNVSNVQMIVDLPESCEFVENSVMVGNSTSSYTLNGNQITIPMALYTDRVRFCIIPTLGGDYAPSAFAQFDLNGETVSQPIGDANYTVQDLFISVPSTVAKTSVLISGTAIGQSAVEIYDDGVLIGNTTSLANGTWETTCELNEPYNLSTHNIYAKVTTKAGLELISETKQVVYDKNMVVPEKVTMLYYNPEFVGQYNIVFDLINGGVSPKSYYFFPYKSYPNWWGSGTEPKDFTFIADLSNNDSTAVNGVTIRVYTDNGYWRNLEAQYNTSMNRWVAVSEFVEEEAPVGVDVEISAKSEPQIDRSYFDDIFDELSNSQNDINNNLEVIESIANALDDENASDEEWMAAYERISELLGIHVNVEEENIELTDEYLQTLIDECGSIISEAWSIDGYLNETIYGNLSELSVEYKDIITVLPCDDLVESQLDQNEYLEFKLTDGSSIYVKTSDSTFELIDFQKNIHYVMHAKEGTELARSLKRAGALDRITSAMTAVKDFGDKISGLMRLITTSMDTASETVLAWKENASIEHQKVFRALTQMGRDAKETGKVNGIMRTTLRWQLRSLKSTIAAMESCEKLLSKISKGISGLNLLINIANAYNDLNGYVTLYNHPKLNHCPDNSEGVQNIRNHIIAEGAGTAAFYVLNIGLDLVSLEIIPTGIAGAPISAGSTLAAVGVAITKLAASVLLEKAHSSHVKQVQESISDDILRLKCKDEEKCPRCGKNPCECKDKCPRCGNRPCTCPNKCTRCGRYPCVCPPPPNTTDVQHDPSGYVYEGVASNRLQGVIASCYYKETVEDMYGDLHDNVVLWDAEKYAQENPLFTDEDGFYRWDVPKGLWQVKFEKEGYETTYSEWLPVPPPQLDINIAMKQNRQPEVKAALAYEDAVEVEFDKYMLPELLTTENILVMQNGTAVEGTVELLNEEVSYEGKTETFASKIRFNAAQPFTEQEITLLVTNRVKSYAGIRMQDNYQQTFTVEQEIKQIESDSLAVVGYGDKSTITVSVLPVAASKGKVLSVKTSSPMILSAETEHVVIGYDGKADISISGELPGTAALTFSVEGTDKVGQTIVNVLTNKTVATPRTSIASGTTVEKGTTITLSCATEGATIYYTLDGSCPCDDTSSRKVYDGTPIVITGNVTIKVMATYPNMDESEVAEFVYTVKGTDSIKEVTLDDHLQIYPIPVHDILNISAEGKIIKSVTISSTNGTLVASSNKATTKVTLDVSSIRTGIYIVTIITEDGTYSRKISKQ